MVTPMSPKRLASVTRTRWPFLRATGAFQSRKERRQSSPKALPPRHAKEEPQTLWRGWVVYYLVAVAQLSGHDARHRRARGVGQGEFSCLFTTKTRAPLLLPSRRLQ
jgi:hypothetical protein